MSTDDSPSTILSKQTFELRMLSHKIKHKCSSEIHKDSVCLFKVIDVGPPFKRKSAYAFANKTIQLSIKTGNQHPSEC